MTPTIIYIILEVIILIVFLLALFEYQDKRKIVKKFKESAEELEKKSLGLTESHNIEIKALEDLHNEELKELGDLHIASVQKLSKDYVETIEDQNNALSLYEKHLIQLDYTIEYTSKVIKELDIRGAYESDDELGIFFKAVKEMQGFLEKFKLEKSEQDEVQD